jgi:hypothetical protein
LVYALRGLSALMLGGVALVLLAGCRDDEQVVHYTVPKPPTYPAPEVKERLLGALFPQGNRAWGFKVAGPVAAIKEHEPAIDRFLHSVRLDDKGTPPISWTLPEGWQEKLNPNDPVRYAAMTFGSGEHALRLTVSLVGGLDAENRVLILNINRWRDMVGLRQVASAAEATKNIKTENINGVPAYLVDLAGPGGNPRKGMGR